MHRIWNPMMFDEWFILGLRKLLSYITLVIGNLLAGSTYSEVRAFVLKVVLLDSTEPNTDLVFHILVAIRDFESWKDCQLSDTFMAEQPTVYISISAPCTDQKTGKIYPPAISFCIDSDPAHLLSRVEVEEMLGVEITLETWWWECMLPQKQLSTIKEINALCGFDPALRGTDICAYFDLLQLQLSSCQETGEQVKYGEDYGGSYVAFALIIFQRFEK